MDYILNHINDKIARFEGEEKAKIYFQVRVEYSFYLLLSYFWSENFEDIGAQDFIMQGNIVRDIQRPSIGTIGSIIERLDIKSELDKSKTNTELTAFAEIRNDLIGHGYSFEDDLSNYNKLFDEWFEKLLSLRIPILNRNTDLILCKDYDEVTKSYTGTMYTPEGRISSRWKCPGKVFDFEIGNLYASYEPNSYIRVSPFIHIDEDDNDALYVFRSVEQPLTGKIRYNRIGVSDNTYNKSWPDFELSASNGSLKKQPNGSIINAYTPNYKLFIEVGSIKKRVYEFLTGKEKGSSVCITLWGHGGNGKTATVQQICEELSLSNTFDKFGKPPFEYIFFLTAKDRELNQYTGKIDSISSENRIVSFDDLIEKLNLLLYSEQSKETKRIIAEQSKMLLVIDDYETFEDNDKEKITQFIKELNLNYHKVIITTRNSFLKIGDDIPTNELDITSTIKFLFEILANEHQYTPAHLKEVDNDIKQKGLKDEIHKITLGKPIEIIRFVNCFVQKGRISNSFIKDMARINSRSERIEFLYGQNYKQLGSDRLAQDIFVAIGLLTPQDTLTSLVSHVKLILNKKEEDENNFNSAIDKLVKLRLIDVDEDGSYKVDSKDILEIMKTEFEKRDALFRSAAKAIYERIKTSITTDTDRALLNHVKTLRHQSNPETAIQQYKEILRQGKDFSYEIKKEALLDLTDFLFNHRGDKDAAVKLFDEYFDKFYEFAILKRYVSYAWAIDKEKAIKILEDFQAKYSLRNVKIGKNHKIHLLGLIVMRETQFWNDKFDRHLSSAKKNQVDDQFSRIHKAFGHLLYSNLKSITPQRELNSEEFNDISLALEGYVDILYRLYNKSLAIEMCDYVLNTFPERFVKRFASKKARMRGYRTASFQNYGSSTSSTSDNNTPVAEKLEIINLELREYGYSGEIFKIHRDATNYGYIKLSSKDMKGRIYFRENSLKNGDFNSLKVGDKVTFGFGKLSSTKYGAIKIESN